MNHATVLRRMTVEDLPAVLEVEHRAYPFPWTQGIFADCIRVGYACWLLERDRSTGKQTIAYMVLSIAANEMHILNICVDPDLQGQGIGRGLLEDAETYARDNNAAMCFLEVRPSNKAAVKLYLSSGFNEVGIRKNYYKDNGKREDAIVMAKSLALLEMDKFTF
jgi:ribosomal-protein-alanine N-acetyltransferase